jgi:hypothetical protein
MKNKVVAILGLALVIAPLMAGTASAGGNSTGGGCKVVYYGSTGPVCETQAPSSSTVSHKPPTSGKH